MKTFDEIKSIIEQVNAKTGGDFVVYDSTPSSGLNWCIKIYSNKFRYLSLQAVDVCGFSGNFENFFGAIAGRCSDIYCNADNLYEFLIDRCEKYDKSEELNLTTNIFKK